MTERLFVRLEEDPLHGPESSAPAGTLSAYEVAPELRGAVSQVLLYRETLPDGVEVRERVLPDGAVRIVFDFAGEPSARVIGASTAPALVGMRGRNEGLSIALLPGAAVSLFGVHAATLSESMVALDELWRDDARALLDGLASADDRQRVSLVQAALARRASADSAARSVRRATKLLSASGGRMSLRELAAAVGVGERRLQQLFQAHVGVSPRGWSRLARMHDVLRTLRTMRTPSWANVAAEHGFYDQPHLVNEFRALAGITPTEFLARAVSGSSKTDRAGARYP